MFSKKEIPYIIVAILVLTISISLWNFEILLPAFVSVFFIVLINILAKKISAHYFESEIENKLWETQRYGFKPHKYFRKPIPIGAFLPFVTSLISLGYFIWFSSLIFDVKPKSYRAAKRHGLYSYTEMSEADIGYIASFGILANLFFAILGYLLGFELFSKLNVYYAFFNMFPVSDLDGNKIFFGNIVLWSFLAALILIGLGYVFLVY